MTSFNAKMEINRVPAQNWNMTFKDLAFDIETIWYAFLWFQDPQFGVPTMDIEVNRFGTCFRSSCLTFRPSPGIATMMLGVVASETVLYFKLFAYQKDIANF